MVSKFRLALPETMNQGVEVIPPPLESTLNTIKHFSRLFFLRVSSRSKLLAQVSQPIHALVAIADCPARFPALYFSEQVRLN